MSQFNIVEIAEAKSHFFELVKTPMLGDEVVIGGDNKPIPRLIPKACAAIQEMAIKSSTGKLVCLNRWSDSSRKLAARFFQGGGEGVIRTGLGLAATTGYRGGGL